MSFDKDGYLIVKNFLSKDKCDYYSEYLKKLEKEKILHFDGQVPTAKSIYSAPEFDDLLNDFTERLEQIINLKLYPTYSYARLYSKGDILFLHRDRPACEISITLSLGFNNKTWSFYLAKNDFKYNPTKIDLDIGDIVIYKAIDLYHWREPLEESDWVTQCFFHYVNKNGRFKDFKFDQRNSLNLTTNK
jgi:hypothetical protein